MGWDIDRFPEGEVNSELICCICTCILEDPVESPCRHVFCSKCIRTWLANQKSCPHCRATVRKRDLQPVVPLLKNIISKQRIFCDYKHLGCLDVVPLELLNSHLAVCQYGTIKCSNVGCNVNVLRKDYKIHADTCTKRMVMCDRGCEMFLTLGEKGSHNCIRSLYSHFQNVTNELLNRISKLEEQVNVLTAKNRQPNNVQSSRPLPHSSVSDTTYTCAPYTIPSPRHYNLHPPPYTVYDSHELNNSVNLTTYTIGDNESSDAGESVDSVDLQQGPSPSRIHETSPAGLDNRTRSPTPLLDYIDQVNYSQPSPPLNLQRPIRMLQRHDMLRDRSRSPQLNHHHHENASFTTRSSRTRASMRITNNLQNNDAFIVNNDNEEPVVLRIGVSQTVSGTSSSSSSSSSTDTE